MTKELNKLVSCILYFPYTYYPHLYAKRYTLGLFTNNQFNKLIFLIYLNISDRIKINKLKYKKIDQG
ncbi:hypothetical protein ES705_48324 [subsurface metagenome]